MTQTATVRLTLSPVAVHSIHDGDTLRVDIDLPAIFPDITGFRPDIRVAHCNAAELSTADGKAALISVTDWLSTHGPFSLHVYGRDKYGRLLADIEAASGDLLSTFVLTLPGSIQMALAEELGVGRGPV